MTKVKLNESVLKMQLNAENRNRFKAVILSDAFKGRSDTVRAATSRLMEDIADRTWGKNPQARAANKRAAARLATAGKKLQDNGIRVEAKGGYSGIRLRVNMGGRDVQLHCPQEFPGTPCVNFDREFMSRMGASEFREFYLGGDGVNLKQDDPLVKSFWALKDEADALRDAADELTTILDTLFGRSRTLGQAVERWPGLASYAPSILSACRELTVRPEVLDKRIDALKSGKGTVKAAMSIGREE